MSSQLQLKYNPLLLYAGIIYLFFNTLFLPEGLYFTTLLSPLFFIGLVKLDGLKYYIYFFVFTLLLALIQCPKVEHIRDYITSFVLLQSLAIFVVFVAKYAPYIHFAELYKSLATLNIFFLVVAIITLFVVALRPIMWYLVPISNNIPIIPRLKMFTSEASYYSFIIAPIFAYYLLKKVLLHNTYNILFFTLLASLILSFSLGVILSLVFSLICILIFNWNDLRFKTNLSFLFGIGFFIVVLSITAYYFFPHNALFERIKNIYTGKDTSSRGRTYESFEITWNVIKTKSVWWGCGPGQFKYIGKDFFNYFYQSSNQPTNSRIHNAVAETLCIYGVSGLIIRFSVVIFLFVKTKVWNNYYRQFLFVFIFVYQFTGSYLFNPAEYVIWVLVFTPSCFSMFDKSNFVQKII